MLVGRKQKQPGLESEGDSILSANDRSDGDISPVSTTSAQQRERSPAAHGGTAIARTGGYGNSIEQPGRRRADDRCPARDSGDHGASADQQRSPFAIVRRGIDAFDQRALVGHEA
jgi:hypothetical protein